MTGAVRNGIRRISLRAVTPHESELDSDGLNLSRKAAMRGLTDAGGLRHVPSFPSVCMTTQSSQATHCIRCHCLRAGADARRSVGVVEQVYPMITAPVWPGVTRRVTRTGVHRSRCGPQEDHCRH